jgi:TetR/AcrR family transcriptional regulator, regulator of cefoperazone and chloramphenicol sensitivity
MPTGPGPAERAPEDLTTTARIRDAAMAQFADRGFKAATMKSIAEEAGVSVGLVQHHFGTKDGLREACNDAVLTVIRRRLELVNEIDTQVANPDFSAMLHEANPLTVRYLIRLLVEGAPEADVIYDELAAGTARFLSETRPDLFPTGSDAARYGGTIMVAMHLGTAVLEAQIRRGTGIEVFDPQGRARVGLVMLDIYSAMGDWVTSEIGRQARAAVSAFVQDLSPTSQNDDQETSP